MDTSSYLRVRYTAGEVFQITKPKLNVVISGLTEADHDVQDFLHLPMHTTTYRHVCLQIHTLETRRQLLEMWKNPKDMYGSRPSIYVRPDLTKSQLHTDKLFRQLIAGKDRFMIHKTSVIIPYVEGVSEAVARVYGVSTAMRPHATIRNLLVHPKDKVLTHNIT